MQTTTAKKGKLTQTGEVGPAPPLSGEPVVAPSLPYRLSARVDVDYVAGGARDQSGYARTLPAYIDDLSERLGPDVYKQMLRDAQVSGDLRYLRLSALSNGVTLLPAVKEDQPYYKKAVTIRDWCQENLDGMEGDLGSILFDMLECVATGYRAAVIVLREEGGQYRLHKVQPKPNDTLAFVVDNKGNTIGLQVMLAGSGRGILNQTSVDPSQMSNLFPRHKFAVCTFLPSNNDPRGQSLLYGAYDHWYQKQRTLTDLAKFLARFGSPSIIGITAPDEVGAVKFDAEGNVINDAYGMPIVLSPEQRLLDALVEWQNASALALKHGSTATVAESQSNGEAFRFAIEMHNQGISKAVLSNTLTTNESEHQTRAATGKQKNVSDLIIEEVEKTAARMIRRDILYTLLLVNYDEATARKFCPKVSLSSVEEADFEGLASGLTSAGWKLAPEQLPEADKKAGFTPRSAEAVAKAEKAVDIGLIPKDSTTTPPKNPAFAEFYNPRHVASGPHGGEFAEGGGAGSGGIDGGDNSENRTPQPERSKEAEQKVGKHGGIVVDAAVQRYAETKNEPHLASTVGGKALKDNEPIDVHIKAKKGETVEHGIEMKTMVSNKSGKIQMKTEAKALKSDWEKSSPGRVFHTVVYDDRKVYNAKGEGQHGPVQNRKIYYRRGYGSFTVTAMEPVKNQAHLKELINAADKDLPSKARRK